MLSLCSSLVQRPFASWSLPLGRPSHTGLRAVEFWSCHGLEPGQLIEIVGMQNFMGTDMLKT